MPLWTNADTVAGKPKIGGRAYNEEYKRELFATVAGWSKVGAGRSTTGKDHEVLVAIRGLSTTGMGDGGATAVKANITSMNWNISSYSRAAGGTLSISVNFNEAVTVTGSPTLAVNNAARANHSLTYSAADSTANRMTFTLVIAAGHASLQAGDVLGILATNQVALAGGGVVGADGQAALITHAADMGQGTLTAVA
jgi:hypothetical protein